jgi:hypothetical protein
MLHTGWSVRKRTEREPCVRYCTDHPGAARYREWLHGAQHPALLGPQALEVQMEHTPPNAEALQQHFSRRASAARIAARKPVRKVPLPPLPDKPKN